MALSDIVSVSVSTESVQVEREGFGVPLILAADAPGGFTERVRFYSSLTELATDFASTTATYKAAAKCFGATPKLPRLAVGRLANKPTQRWAVTPTVTNSTSYEMEFNGNAIEYTSDGSATAAEIIAGLKADIDALSLAVTVTDQTTYMRIACNNAGETFSVESLDVTKLQVKQDHADPGVEADLNAIALEDSSWYAIINPFNSTAMASAIATWAEANKKLFICQTQESATITVAAGSDTGGSKSLAKTIQDATQYRTATIYHPNNWDFADAALAGKCLPLDPGSETWKFKSLAGVSVVTLTSTQRTNALAKNCNIYTEVAGVGITEEGKTAAGEWIDVIRFRDWLEARLREEVFAALASAKKVPFTDGGISIIEGIVRGVLAEGIAAGGLASDPEPTVTVPLASSVSNANKTARILTPVKFDAVLAGAIHAVSISGTITV